MKKIVNERQDILAKSYHKLRDAKDLHTFLKS